MILVMIVLEDDPEIGAFYLQFQSDYVSIRFPVTIRASVVPIVTVP